MLTTILRALLGEGATEPDLVRVTTRIEQVSFKRARELVYDSGLVAAGPRHVTIVVPEGDPWRGELFTTNSSNEDVGESELPVMSLRRYGGRRGAAATRYV